MVDILATILSGGATGILGALFSKGFGIAEKWMDAKEKAADRLHELKLLDKQMEARAAETENERYIADAEAFTASYKLHDNIGAGSQWVVNILRLVRPVLTLLLVSISAVIFFSLQPEDVLMRETIVQGVIYTTTTAVLWWFGTRPSR